MQGFDWMGTLINWFPMILIFGVWILFIRRMQSGKGFYQQSLDVQKDILAANLRQADALERLAAALEKRAL